MGIAQNPTGVGGLGYGQSWQGRSAPALGVTYYNTTGRPIQVMIATQNSLAGQGAALVVNGVTMYTSGAGANGYYVSPIYAVMPPGASYVLNTNGGATTIIAWSECK